LCGGDCCPDRTYGCCATDGAVSHADGICFSTAYECCNAIFGYPDGASVTVCPKCPHSGSTQCDSEVYGQIYCNPENCG
jgi:hypothetical protein